MDKSTAQKRSFAPPDRKYIQCDAEDCGAASPKMKCSRCHLAYYCSKACQRSHFPIHKYECLDLEQIKAHRQISNAFSDEGHVDMLQQFHATGDVSCGVCLEDKITSPYSFKSCRHVFCFPCLQSYQMACLRIGQPLKCPLCRAKTEDVHKSLWADAFFHLRKAHHVKSSIERQESLQKALQLLDLISKDDDALYSQALTTKVNALDMLGDYESALIVIDQIIALDDAARRSNRLGRDDRIEILVLKSTMYEKLEKWEKAGQCYGVARSLLYPYQTEDLQQHLSIWIGISRCLYHVGEWDKAIEVAQFAIDVDRCFTGVHKYAALSYKAKGELEMARKLATHAVLYEAPWDDDNMCETKVLLEELINTNDESSLTQSS